MDFALPVAEEKVKPHQVTALHLLCALVFIGSGALFYWLFMASRLPGISLIAGGLILLGITIGRNKWLVTGKANQVFRILELLVLLTLLTVTALKSWWVPTTMFSILSLAIMFALYWEKPGTTGLQIIVGDDGIKLPLTSRRRFIEWTEVEKVLLRYGTLTVDCHNKRLFQWNVRQNDTDSEILEAYCDSKVEEYRAKRPGDDW